MRPPRRPRPLLLLPLLLVPLLGSAGAARADGPGWTAEPAAGSATGAGGARPSFYLQGAPGSVLEDRLALANTTDQERTLTLRGADAHRAADGAFAVRPPGRSTGAGGWISFGAAGTVKVPPRTRAVVPFTVTVPPAAAPGDHPVAVVATEGGHEADVRVHLRVSGPQVAALTVEDVRVRGRGAGTVVAYALVNRGNVALAPEVGIDARGLFGDVPGRRAHPVGAELLPGQRVELTEPWPGAPVLDRVELTVTAGAAGAGRAGARASAWFLPWGIAGTAGAGLLVLGGLTLLARVLVRRALPVPRPRPARGRIPAGTSPADHHEPTGAAR
ncbi:COG1470 family protein [Streptomyces antimicrobicus]|uniref:DUF916 domain-containing protein n=1 Tax=Streptomyces antimicrobicus TaxID=2883108 RepID=A0ABS8B3B0_9ACTN|nr:hypothetical protein [Streptomyces antimicrobicus]MCB5179086.1 hypothetical protein [Streptomyces antimicrobicus]